MPHPEPRALLTRLFESAVSAADPLACIANFLPPPPKGRTIVIGAGKAAASMAQAIERNWPGDLQRLSGCVVTRYGHSASCEKVAVLEASHPVPDRAGELAAQRLLDSVKDLNPDDLVICLISGGGSALLPHPLAGVSLADKQAISRALLKSGANISEMNCVRKHLSAIKGGRLALACAPARLHTLIISDVPGDDPAVVASGPTVADASSCSDALDIIGRYAVPISSFIENGLRSGRFESPKPGDPRLPEQTVKVIASNQISLQSAAETARAAGITPVVLGDSMEGEARDVARVHAAIAKQIAAFGQPARPPCVLLSGGETTVTVRGTGRGGRNAEFALALAISLGGTPSVWALAADTDGIDGSEDNAGVFVGPDSLVRAQARGLVPARFLENNDAYSFFDSLGDLLVTGPTRTNVNDLRAVLIQP